MNLKPSTPHTKRRSAAVIFLLFVVLAGVFTYLLFSKLHSITADTQTEKTYENTEYVAADVFGVMFVLREHNGSIAVLNSLESQVLEILDIPVHALPENARAELDGGICITSVTELVEVISSFENDVALSQK